MKSLFSIACFSLSLALVGCNKGEPGGPGATRDKEKVASDATFTLDVPNTATKVTQGETKNTSISLRRGKNFSEDVKLTFSDVPKGVTIDPSTPTIAKSDTEAKIAVKAADDAAVGDFVVKVHGVPTKGTDAKNEFKISVSKK